MNQKIAELKQRIDATNDTLSRLAVEAQHIVTDQTIPLDERWQFFVDAKLGSHDRWIVHFKSLNEDKNYNTDLEELIFPEHRGAVVSTVDSATLLTEVCNTPGNFTYNGLVTPETVRAFKEEVLSLFIKSFEFDW